MTIELTLEQAARLCDRIVGLRDGEVVFDIPAPAEPQKVADLSQPEPGEVVCDDIDDLNDVWNKALQDSGC